MAKSLAIILAIFGCGIIGVTFIALEGVEIANSITTFVMTNFYHQTPQGQAFNLPDAWDAIGIGVFAIILAATVFLAPKIMERRR